MVTPYDIVIVDRGCELDALTIAADIATIVGATATVVGTGWVIGISWYNWDKVSAVFRAIIAYGNRISVSELSNVIEELSNLRFDDESQKQRVIELFAVVHGKLRGNSALRAACNKSFQRIHALLRDKSKLTLAAQRSVVHELRESIRAYELSQIAKHEEQAT